jgi:hypothetical protein
MGEMDDRTWSYVDAACAVPKNGGFMLQKRLVQGKWFIHKRSLVYLFPMSIAGGQLGRLC